MLRGGLTKSSRPLIATSPPRNDNLYAKATKYWGRADPLARRKSTIVYMVSIEMSNSVSLQKAIEYVEALSPEDQDLLLELIQQRRRRREIANNAAQTLAAMQAGTAKRGTLEELKADLLDRE